MNNRADTFFWDGLLPEELAYLEHAIYDDLVSRKEALTLEMIGLSVPLPLNAWQCVHGLTKRRNV
jgi:hypothetical protein